MPRAVRVSAPYRPHITSKTRSLALGGRAGIALRYLRDSAARATPAVGVLWHTTTRLQELRVEDEDEL